MKSNYIIAKNDALTALVKTANKRFLGSQQMGKEMYRFIKTLEVNEIAYDVFMTKIQLICNPYFKRIAEVGKSNIKFYRSFKYRCYHCRNRKENKNNGEKEEN